MKKLLSILAAISMTATAASSVVACGSGSSSKDNKDDDLIISSNGIKVTSDEMLEQMLNTHQWNKIFGDQGTAIKNFMNYFAEAFMKSVADKTPDISKNELAASYTNDYTFKTIQDNWKTRNTNANDAWDKAVADAKDNGKKWADKFFDQLKDKYGEDIAENGETRKAKSYSDYKNKFISDAVLTGAGSTDSKSIFSALSDNIFSWAKTPSNTTFDSVIGNLKTYLFEKTYKIGDVTVDFSKANVSGNMNDASFKRENSLLGQMDNVLKIVSDANSKDNATAKDLLNYVVQMYNITGGLDPQSKDDFNVASIKWATKDNIKDKLSDITKASNELIERMDSSFNQDFGPDAKSGTNATKDHLMINDKYNFKDKINYIPNDDQSGTPGDDINGLYSNTQRFVANDYYNVEKPVAVSEIVISPTQSSTVDYSQQITNSGYVGTDIKEADQLYSFIGNFINNSIDSSFSAAKTNDVIDGTPNYTWDDLMANVSGTWDKNVKTGASDWDSTFKGKVKFNAHSNLLTMDSPTSDYSNLLKYSVYDYLTNAKKPADYTFKTDAATALGNETSIDAIKQANPNPSDMTVDQYTTEYNVLTNFIHDMNRTAKSKSMYQVVNSKQGIISFIDSDGIHFVRIEGYNLLNDTSLVGDQQALSMKDFGDAAKGDAAKANYDSAITIKNAIADDKDAVKNAAVMVSSDYDNKADKKSKLIGVKYDDLNKGFGNKYLRFLANSSIAKSAGYSSPKYSYDLNELLKNYVSSDITTDSVLKNSTMILMAWNYAKMILGINNDDAMFGWVIGNSSVGSYLANSSLSEKTQTKFQTDYKKYIISDILSKYADSNRINKANEAFRIGLKKVDADVNSETTWKDNSKKMEELHPSLRWSQVIGGSDSASAYESETKGLTKSGKWVPYKGADTPPSPAPKPQEEFSYRVDMDQFITNEYALEGDED